MWDTILGLICLFFGIVLLSSTTGMFRFMRDLPEKRRKIIDK